MKTGRIATYNPDELRVQEIDSDLYKYLVNHVN